MGEFGVEEWRSFKCSYPSPISHYSSLYPRPYRSNFARIHPCEAEALLAEVFQRGADKVQFLAHSPIQLCVIQWLAFEGRPRGCDTSFLDNPALPFPCRQRLLDPRRSTY